MQSSHFTTPMVKEGIYKKETLSFVLSMTLQQSLILSMHVATTERKDFNRKQPFGSV